jgi:hypothetical protein
MDREIKKYNSTTGQWESVYSGGITDGTLLITPDKIGDLSTLTTTAKTSTVAAINEVKSSTFNLGTSTYDIKYNSQADALDFIDKNSNAIVQRLYRDGSLKVLGQLYEVSAMKIGFDLTKTETTQADFSTGTLANVSATVSPGDLTLELGTTPQATVATPVMTSNTAPSGIVTASSTYNATYDAFHAFDQGAGTWNTSSGTTTGWIAYEFTSAKRILRYSLKAGNAVSAPSAWTFDGSNDGGTTWTALHSQSGITNWTNGMIKTFDITNNTAYKKYRVYCPTGVNGDNVLSIDEISMYEAVPYQSSGTRISTYDLSQVKIAKSAKVSWTQTLPTNTTLTIQTSLDGTNYNSQTNNGAITGISNGLNTAGKTLYVKQTLSTTDTTVTPKLNDMYVECLSLEG